MYVPYTKPFDHQLQTWEQSRDALTFAAFWEQGTGKTKLDIDTTAYQFTEGLIDAAIVVAPNGVHRNWITDELPTHMNPDLPVRAFAYKSDAATAKWHSAELSSLLNHNGLPFLAISYDAWMTERGKKIVWDLMRKRRVKLTLDESHRIKTPSAKRTQSIVRGGKHAVSRRVLSGTPITQGPFDLYSQIKFLEPDFWKRTLDIDSFTAFKSTFGIWEKGMARDAKGDLREYDALAGYQNLEELHAIIQPISSRVLKEDVLDLPPKLYTKRYYEMTPLQRRLYKELDEEFMTLLDNGELISAPLVITKLLRMQQVLCGYAPVDGDREPTELLDRANMPRLKLLRETMEDVTGKAIVWATWTKDIEMILDMLRDLGRDPVRYDGKISDDERQRSKDRFKKGNATDFVAIQSMSEGLTLNEAHTTVYYNNSYQLLHRKQSEDRNHRAGQTNPVLYIDLVCAGSRDEEVIAALVKKNEVAGIILGDRVKEWI